MGGIDPGATIGHVHLKVADLDRALAFYRDALGMDVTGRLPGAVFLSAGGYHHHVALNTWQSRGGTPPPPGSTGLFHLAIRYPTRAALARAVRRLLEHSAALEGASDHGVSESVYLRDPDDNGIEVTWDRPGEAWPRGPDGQVRAISDPLDLAALLSEAG